jgi:outer membrane autotransporter protein
MKKMASGFRPLLLCSLISACSCSFAANFQITPGFFDIVGAGSISSVNAGKGRLGITSSETDTLHQTNSGDWNSWGGQFGLGYVYIVTNPRLYYGDWQWFSMVEPQLNVYVGNYKVKGDIYRFGSSAFNQLSYNMPVKSIRLMFDTALTVLSMHEYSVYAIGGLGESWNRIAYNDYVNSGDTCNTQNLKLSNHDSSNFAWEAGAGVNYAFSDIAMLSFEYLYTDFGRLQTSSSGNAGTITTPVISAGSFDFHTQALLFGLHVTLR